MSNTFDVVVVGAGILGAATAFELSKVGLKVAVIEQGAINRAGSGATAGNLHIQAVHRKRPQQEIPLDQFRFLPLQLAASRLWDAVESELESDIEMRRVGGITVAESEADVIEILDKRQVEIDLGIPGEILDPAQLRDFEPLLGPHIKMAEFCPLDGYVNPLKITPAWLRAGVRRGVNVNPFTPVSSISREGGGWRVTSNSESWSAEKVVLVVGPWMTQLLKLVGVQIRMNPVAIQMHLTERAPPTMRYLVQHIGQGLSVKQVTSGQILIGGGWPAKSLNLGGVSPVSFDSVVGNLQLATKVLPFLEHHRLLRSWTGALGATADEMPVIGEIQETPGIFIAGGTYSFTFAPLWAKILMQLITNQNPELSIKGLEPERLIETKK